MRAWILVAAMLMACDGEEAAETPSAPRKSGAASKPAAAPAAKRSESVWIGLKHQDPDKGSGARVIGVSDDGPAEKAGFEEDDVVLAIDGKMIKRSADLLTMVKKLQPGKTVSVLVLRNGKKKELKMVPERRED